MKRASFILAGLVAVSLSSVAFGSHAASKTPKAPTAIHIILENSALVREYASIYEWDNVTLEVDRIVAAESKLQKSLAKDEKLADKAANLHSAVKELRSARLNQDPDRAVRAADRVAEAAHELGK